ncbi:MAG TPA: hypothetical protein VGI39_20620 [Polyangiaceae bacterium]|jgi:hypothetical protein
MLEQPAHGASPEALVAVRALAEALFSTEEGPPPRERLDWLTREYDDFLGRAGARARLLLGLSLLVVSVLAPFFGRRSALTLRHLSLPDRIAALEHLERSVFAMPLLGVKAILSFLYYEHPDAAREIGFTGGCLKLPGGGA